MYVYLWHDFRERNAFSFLLPTILYGTTIYLTSNIINHMQEDFEDTNGVVRIRISKKNRQHNGQKKKYKRTNIDLQNVHIQLKIEYREPH
jgi:hypothetical protein